MDWTYGSPYEGNRYRLAYDIVAAREAALASDDISKWKTYKTWLNYLYSMYTNVFDSAAKLEEWAVEQIKYTIRE